MFLSDQCTKLVDNTDILKAESLINNTTSFKHSYMHYIAIYTGSAAYQYIYLEIQSAWN